VEHVHNFPATAFWITLAMALALLYVYDYVRKCVASCGIAYSPFSTRRISGKPACLYQFTKKHAGSCNSKVKEEQIPLLQGINL
jgi:hypothetical protein